MIDESLFCMGTDKNLIGFTVGLFFCTRTLIHRKAVPLPKSSLSEDLSFGKAYFRPSLVLAWELFSVGYCFQNIAR